MARRAYVVREDHTRGEHGSVDRLYPYTLKGLTDALDEARFRSYSGPAQTVTVLADNRTRVIRRYEHGREVPDTSASG
jgi:hypothetical protein